MLRLNEMKENIMHHCFANSKIPTEWSRGIINPFYKNDGDPRNPLVYRPITLISIPCKVYAQILCLDHIYLLHSIRSNRKMSKRTPLCVLWMRRKHLTRLTEIATRFGLQHIIALGLGKR